MADLTRAEMKLLDEHDHARDELLRSYLDRMGVQYRGAGPFSADSSYPYEHTLSYGPVSVTEPTFDLAVVAFVEALLKHVPMERYIYNQELDERNRISAENRDKPWLPLHDGE